MPQGSPLDVFYQQPKEETPEAQEAQETQEAPEAHQETGAEVEAASEEAAPEAEQKEPQDALGELSSVLLKRHPEWVIEGKEDLVQKLESLVEAYDTLEALEEAIDDWDFEAIKALAQGDRARALEILSSRPDPKDDPERYTEWLLKQKELEQKRQEEEKRQKELEQKERLVQKRMEESAKRFREKYNLSEDQLRRFQRDISRLLSGDPDTGLPPSNFYEVLYRGLYFDEITRNMQKGMQENVAEKGSWPQQSLNKTAGAPRAASKPKSDVEFLEEVAEERNRLNWLDYL